MLALVQILMQIQIIVNIASLRIHIQESPSVE
jgi:hypothetical protein